ncbi:hypothetical protein GCM10009108_14250 [Castellaniella ginsengisoli]|uniref:Uncharacterized protein n=1 Tax=Castellaniella ginsengisoli TaxID=546114 RepID=A0ABN1KWV7_9BURK
MTAGVGETGLIRHEGISFLVTDEMAGKRKKGSDAFESGTRVCRCFSPGGEVHYIGCPRVCQSGIGAGSVVSSRLRPQADKSPT